MGSYGKKIVDLDIDNLITILNKALADEWLAYYQYWVGSKVVKGLTSESVKIELIEHASEELKHANMLADRIMQLGGVPVLDPKNWFELANCKYIKPDNFFVKEILKQNISAERCAIMRYQELIKITENKDPITYNIAVSILEDEVEHEDDLEKLLEDIEIKN